MTNNENLITAATRLREAGEAIIACAEALAASIDKEAQPAPAEKEITLVDVRRVLTAKAREGKTDLIKDLLKKHSAEKLSEVPQEDYPLLIKEAEAL